MQFACWCGRCQGKRGHENNQEFLHGSDVFIFLPGIETGARFIGKFVVTVDGRLGITLAQFFEQIEDAHFLRRSSGIEADVLPVLCGADRTAALIADAD